MQMIRLRTLSSFAYSQTVKMVYPLRIHAYAICSVFHGCKNEFSGEKIMIFLIFALNIGRGYTLEPPH